ncbi:MAG: hypothetical protein HY865_27100 [Chloroflexi bacterium]|nr:hypothetical protein [Chloroflexota bacterium]
MPVPQFLFPGGFHVSIQTRPDRPAIQAVLPGSNTLLTLEQALSRLRKRERIQIERTYPGSPETIGWTIFRRAPPKYLYETTPLFRFERGARRYIRKAYAIHYSRLTSDDGMTYSHLNL